MNSSTIPEDQISRFAKTEQEENASKDHKEPTQLDDGRMMRSRAVLTSVLKSKKSPNSLGKR